MGHEQDAGEAPGNRERLALGPRSRLEAATAFGATHVINADEEDVVETVRSLTHGLGADFAFESSGLTSCMAQAVAAVRPGGTVVLLGMAASSAPFTIDNIAEVILQEKLITGSLMGSGIAARDFPRLVTDYLDGSLMLDELVTRRRPLAEINEAVVDMQAGRGLRTVLTF
jgi:S-(hydroxymethyl)glutathione dehydrogenase/alcohol dehydrogenase